MDIIFQEVGISICAFIFSLFFTRSCAYFIQSKNKRKSVSMLMLIFVVIFIPLSLLSLYIPYWKCGLVGSCSYTFYGGVFVIPLIFLGMIVGYNVFIRKWIKTDLQSNPVPFFVLVLILLGILIYSYSVYKIAVKPFQTYNSILNKAPTQLLQPIQTEILNIETVTDESYPDAYKNNGFPEFILTKNKTRLLKSELTDKMYNTKEDREIVAALAGAFSHPRGLIDYNNDGTAEHLYEVRKSSLDSPYEIFYAIVSADMTQVLGTYRPKDGIANFYGTGDYLSDKNEGFIIREANSFKYYYIQFK